MNKTKTLKKIIMVAMIAAVSAIFPNAAGAAATGKTLANLQAAFNGESNATAKYLAYAKKADQEGYSGVAKLFRAAAQAETIHAKNHGEVIKAMGGVPMAEIKLPEIKSTRANLEDAIQGETYEQQVMYPQFLKEAAAENNSAADQTFTYARAAEAEHAKLYTMALNNLEDWKSGDRQFNVCPVCGFTVQGKPDFANCPVCGEPGENYLATS